MEGRNTWRHRPRGIGAWALGVFLVAAAVAPTQGARAEMGAPVWAAGDLWTYLFSAPGQIPSAANLTFLVLGTDAIPLKGTQTAAYHVRMGYAFVGGGNESFERWYRVSDLAVMRSVQNATGTAGWPPVAYRDTRIDTYNPPVPLGFPLVPGASQMTNSTVTTENLLTQNGFTNVTWGNATGTAFLSVGSDLTVTVPAGTFTATQVNASYTLPDGTATEWAGLVAWSATAGNVVKVVTPIQGATIVLTSYRHALPPPGLPIWLWGVGVSAVAAAVVIVLWHGRKGRSARTIPPAGEPGKPAPPEPPR